MAGNAQIPRAATEIDREHGYNPQGERLEVVLYKHTARGHDSPMYWAVQFYRTADSPTAPIRTGTRVTSQVSGRNATRRALGEFAESRAILLATRRGR
jgi:hypothetical protein